MRSENRDSQPNLLRDVAISPNDVALIISNSGRNAVPVELAMEMKSRSVPIIAITSLQHSRSSTAAHPAGKRLFELADIVIDNGAPSGDAIINLAGVAGAMAPASTVTGAAIVHSIMLEAAAELVKRNDRRTGFRERQSAGCKRRYPDRSDAAI